MELKLRSAQRQTQRTNNPDIIQSKLLGMPEADDFVLGTLTMKERRSLALRSESRIHLLELIRRLIDRIQSTILGHIQ